MIRIGDFSRLSHVSVKALRYYDEMGLLKPAYVDEVSGYRYYTAAQMPRLHRLLALKDLGFTLEQIAPLLDEAISTPGLRRLFESKQAELQQHIQEERERLIRVEARLRQIEQEGKMSNYEVVVKQVDAQLVASVHAVAPSMAQIGPTISGLFDAIFAHIGRHGGRICGPGMVLYHDTEFRETDVQIEAAMPIAAPLPDGERVKTTTLPAVETMACTIHHGAFDSLGDAYGAVMKWIEANGYRINGPGREISLHYDRNADPSTYVTEVQFPVAKA